MKRLVMSLAVGSTLLFAGAASAQSLRGDTRCPYGAEDCNTCVNDVLGSFQALSQKPTAQLRYKSQGGKSLPPFNRTLAEFAANDSHVQGIVRLPGVGEDASPAGRGPWFALTRSRPGNVGGSGMFVMQLGDLPTRGGFPIDQSATGEPTAARTTRSYYPIEGLDHAGGLQAIGRHVVMASDCDKHDKCGPFGWMHVFNLSDPLSPNAFVQAMRIGDRGEAGRIDTVTSAAMAKLETGQFLLFVLGKDSAHEGWFYVSEGTRLAPDTNWVYAGHWQRPLGGAYEFQNTQLVTECGSGDLYLIGSGNSDYDGSVDDVAQTIFGLTPGKNHLGLLKIGRGPEGVTMDVIVARQFEPSGGDYCTFRAGASVHATPGHDLVMYCSARKANTDTFGRPDSKLKMEEYRRR